MQAWYVLVLQAAIAIFGSALLSLKNGIATVTALGKDILLTSPKFTDYSKSFITPEQLVRFEVLGEPIVLTDAAKVASRADQIAALVQVRDQVGATPATRDTAQANIDQLQTFWNAQDEAAKPKPPAPPLAPAESDLWRNAAVGEIITKSDKKKYVVEGSAFGNLTRLLTPDELIKLQTSSPAPVEAAAIAKAAVDKVLSDAAGYTMGRLGMTNDPGRQEELRGFLTFLATLK
jgi:cell division protein FtsB